MCLLGLLAGRDANAQVTCAAGTPASDVRAFRINVSSFMDGNPPSLPPIANMHVAELRSSLAHAVAQWANGAAGALPYYDGTTDCLGTPADDAARPECCDHNVVVWGGCAVLGATTQRCSQTRSRIEMCLGSLAQPNQWDFNGVDPTETDFANVLTHELGHALGVDHPPTGGTFATMAPTIAAGDTRGRELYHYDRLCSEVGAAGERALTVAKRVHTLSGIGAATLVAGVSAAVHDADGPSPTTLLHGWRNGDDFVVRAEAPSAPPVVLPNAATGVGFEVGLHSIHESSAGSMSFRWGAPAPGDEWVAGSLHRLNARWSGDGFVTSGAAALGECSAMVPLMTYGCNPLAPILPVASAVRMSTWHHSSVSRTVHAWAVQNRLVGAGNTRAVRIAVGSAGDALFPPATNVPGAGTLSAPGVACSDGAAVGSDGLLYDCVVAWAEMNTNRLSIRTRRFDTPWAAGSTHRVAEFDPQSTDVHVSEAVTGHGVEVWRNNGEWFLGFATIATGQPLRIFRSPDGLHWTSMGSFGMALQGPRVARVSGAQTWIYVTQP